MIPLIWLVGVAIVGAAGVALAVYWKDIVAWLSRVYDKLPDSVKQNLQGATAFVHKLSGVIKNIMNYYSYNEKTQKWTETIVSKEVNENDIPKHIREKMAKTAKVDITDELEEKLELATR